MNGFEKLQSPEGGGVDAVDGYKLCAQNLKFVNKTDASKNGTSPYYSRTSSSSGWDPGLPHRPWHQSHPYNLGDDGLIPVTSVAQERLWQIIQEHRVSSTKNNRHGNGECFVSLQRKEELLEKEVHTYRQALIKQLCHKCNNNDSEKIDDAVSTAAIGDTWTIYRVRVKR